MVGQWPPSGLRSFSTERRCSVDVKTTRELRISAPKLDPRGWMSGNYLSFQRREKWVVAQFELSHYRKVFSLDIPFYRTRR